MMYKRLIFILLIVFGGVSLESRAQYDFAAKNGRGQVLYYQVIGDGDSVRVTHPEEEWPYYADNKPVGELIIPDVVTHEGKNYRVVEIGSNAFYQCDSLTGVHGADIYSVGAQAFCGCVSLKLFMPFSCAHTLTSGVKCYLRSIGEGAFAYCRSLQSVTLHDEMEYIGISAFSMCTGLEWAYISPEAERLCNATTFHGCPLMKEAKNRKIMGEGWIYWSWESEQDEKISR